MEIYGDTLGEKINEINFDDLKRLLKMPVIKPIYRVSVLHPDETIDYEIPSSDIPEGGISFTETYQNGQRKSITLSLINYKTYNSNGEVINKYSPSINGIWLNTKFRLDVGIKVKDTYLWFPKGIYIMGDSSIVETGSDHTVQLQLKDKFAMFEGNTGKLSEAYEIEVGSSIKDVISGLLNTSQGNGYIFDYKDPIIDPSLRDFRTQSTIRVEEGSNYGQVIQELATQMSAEYYYNNVGNLCFYPINSTIDDSSKPVIWVFEDGDLELSNINLGYKNEEVVNVVKVVGDNITSGVKYAMAMNENPGSPICVQQIGKRIGDAINDANIWNNDLAQELANYTLKTKSILNVEVTCDVAFNPIFAVNNICEVENSFLNFKREKILITSISYQSSTGNMSVKFCNTKDLPFM